ncbi:MAG: 30S ribosomal protein S5 [Candidatus Omnitrophica bacterium]|nr:30S ribosomal protein S5 [Candidatus Omnitrophota bacterium]
MPESQDNLLLEKVIAINRVTKTNKGGKTLSFNALVTIGNGNGRVGIGLGKALEVADAIKKGIKYAGKNMIDITRANNTIPYEVKGIFGASKVVLKPASAGTGVIAGGVVRAICEMAGIKDILTKSLGSTNAINLAKATIDGFMQLKPASEPEIAGQDQGDDKDAAE